MDHLTNIKTSIPFCEIVAQYNTSFDFVKNFSKEKISCIYAIINLINNKIYIGSAKNFYHRKQKHLCSLRNNKYENPILQNAFNKYGEYIFVIDIIEVVSNLNELITREQLWMNLLKPEYNICKNAKSRLGVLATAETKLKMTMAKLNQSEETKQKISKALKGRKLSQDTKDKIKKGSIGKPHPPLSEETKQKIRDTRLKYGLNNFLSNWVKKNGNSWKGKKLSIQTKKQIGKSIKNTYKIKKQKGDYLYRLRGKENKFSKPVIQFDLNGNKIKEYESIGIAEKDTKCYNISKMCRSIQDKNKKYIWKFKNNN